MGRPLPDTSDRSDWRTSLAGGRGERSAGASAADDWLASFAEESGPSATSPATTRIVLVLTDEDALDIFLPEAKAVSIAATVEGATLPEIARVHTAGSVDGDCVASDAPDPPVRVRQKSTSSSLVAAAAVVVIFAGTWGLWVRYRSPTTVSRTPVETRTLQATAKPELATSDAGATVRAGVPSSSAPESDKPLTRTTDNHKPPPAPPAGDSLPTVAPVASVVPAVVDAGTTVDESNLPGRVRPELPLSDPMPVIAASLITLSAAEAPGEADTGALRMVLDRYRSAFDDLDASQAKTIWPSVDQKTLGRAFDQLEQQELTLDTCQFEVTGLRAVASCNGRASYVPKVGSKSARLEPRRWTFKLRKAEGDWIIEAVESSVSR